ncbi:MAG: elongation factor P [bacterium]
MITTNDLKNGMVIGVGDEVLEVIEFLHVKPGKGPAFVRTKLRNLRTGAVTDRTFRAGEKMERIRLEEKEMEYLYRDGGNLVFMDSETYDQMQIPAQSLGGGAGLLKENEKIFVQMTGGEIIGIRLPNFVELRIEYTEPGSRGDTVGLATKTARLETGVEVQVPIFLETGDFVKIDTRTRTYVERVRR